MDKFIRPIIDRNAEIENFKYMTTNEQIEVVKERFGLHHGKGKRKKKKYKK